MVPSGNGGGVAMPKVKFHCAAVSARDSTMYVFGGEALQVDGTIGVCNAAPRAFLRICTI